MFIRIPIRQLPFVVLDGEYWIQMEPDKHAPGVHHIVALNKERAETHLLSQGYPSLEDTEFAWKNGFEVETTDRAEVTRIVRGLLSQGSAEPA